MAASHRIRLAARIAAARRSVVAADPPLSVQRGEGFGPKGPFAGGEVGQQVAGGAEALDGSIELGLERGDPRSGGPNLRRGSGPRATRDAEGRAEDCQGEPGRPTSLRGQCTNLLVEWEGPARGGRSPRRGVEQGQPTVPARSAMRQPKPNVRSSPVSPCRSGPHRLCVERAARTPVAHDWAMAGAPGALAGPPDSGEPANRSPLRPAWRGMVRSCVLCALSASGPRPTRRRPDGLER